MISFTECWFVRFVYCILAKPNTIITKIINTNFFVKDRWFEEQPIFTIFIWRIFVVILTILVNLNPGLMLCFHHHWKIILINWLVFIVLVNWVASTMKFAQVSRANSIKNMIPTNFYNIELCLYIYSYSIYKNHSSVWETELGSKYLYLYFLYFFK